VEDEHDRLLRLAAFDRVRELSRRYTDLVPLDILKEGFAFDGRRISFGSFYSGIFRPKELHGPSALALVTAPAKAGKPAPQYGASAMPSSWMTSSRRSAWTPGSSNGTSP